MTLILSIGIALLAGLLMSRVAKVLHFPAVTAYLVAGILIGPFVLGQLVKLGGIFAPIGRLTFIADPDSLDVLSEVALGFIAFSIGNEFRVSQLKTIGKQAVIIGILQAVITTIVVDIASILLFLVLGPSILPLPVCITLGAVAAATAPAATLMVVKQYKAKGQVTGILLPVVALDDVVGLVIFAISFGVAKTLVSGEFDLLAVIVNPILEVVGSLVLGFVMGLLFTWLERYFQSRSKRLSISVAFVFLTIGLSMLEIPIGSHVTLAFSPLLSCMMLATVFCNLCDFSEELMDRLDRWTGPLFILFFVFSGVELNFSVFKTWQYVLVGLVYIISRTAGKMLGARLSAEMMHSDPMVKKHLGTTLLAQGGVALGMSLTAATELGAEGAVIRNIVLFAVLIYELISPTMTKIALEHAGEIQPEGKRSSRGKIGS